MLRACLICCAVFLFGLAQAQDADALRERHAALRDALTANPFGRPLHVRSNASGGEHQGEIYAVLEQPYQLVARALARAGHWCDILFLQVTVKQCEASRGPHGDTLTAFITRQAHDPLDSAYQVDFRHEAVETSANYLRVRLSSASGPVGTRNYRLRLEATPLDAGRTFIRMAYSYELGLMARLAMDAYLSTSGRDKVGFSVVDRGPDGRPVYVDGVRGVVERSAMRYYLAVEAFLDSLAAPPAKRLEKRLRDWYAGIERYPLQLHEAISQDEYLELKLRQAGRAAG